GGAAEQCGGGGLPAGEPPLEFGSAVSKARGLKLMLWEDEREQSLAAYLRTLERRPREVDLFIGPEGGFEPQEVQVARDAGAELLSLGRRILRSATAAIVA